MMPDIPFLILGLLSDAGWITHLIAGAVIGILQIAAYVGASPELVWIVVGVFLNFASGLTIYLSFKKGIFYGVQ